MSADYTVSPLPDDGTRGYRVEIDEFTENNEVTNLFLIALSNLQKDSLKPVRDSTKGDIPNWLNFYAAASIHGRPTEDWNGIANTKHGNYGYCHHGLDTFPVWHRPYMAFYEGCLYKEMVRVAEQYSTEQEKKVYRAAAAQFRLPFWDIVMPRNKYQPGARIDTVWGTPAILAAKDVYVKLPKPTPQAKNGFDQIPNPLYSFVLPTPEERKAANENPKLKRKVLPGFTGFSNKRTVRVPSNEAVDKTNDKMVNLAIQRQAGPNAITLIHMLNPDYIVSAENPGSSGMKIAINEKRSWSDFANHSGRGIATINDNDYPTVSVESWHDGIHTLMGTGDGAFDDDPANSRNLGRYSGHMGTPELAAFDPLFWLHHNNIERLHCLHQALYPDKYLTTNQGEEKLIPFLHPDQNVGFWKGNHQWVKDYWSSGFAVPGATKPAADPAAVKKELKKYLAETYLWASNNTPPTVKNWPRNLAGSWALYGSSATPVAAPTVQISAMSFQSGQAQLVHRTITLASLDGPAEPEAAAPSDDRVRSTQILDLTDKICNSLPAGALVDLADKNKPTYQFTWNAHVKVRKYAFDGSFNIHIFIGHIKKDQPGRFITKKNEVGFTGVFATTNDALAGCSNCVKQRAENMMVEDTIPLTTALYDYLESSPGSADLIRDTQIRTIRDLSPEQVLPFLKENLAWIMASLTATVLEDYQRAGLEILISHRTYLAPDQEHLLGQYGPFIPHPEVTSDRPGGWGYVYPAA